eukprot:scaffold225_cov235-Pinguiococcus_pyrenoidosus.AAC.4
MAPSQLAWLAMALLAGLVAAEERGAMPSRRYGIAMPRASKVGPAALQGPEGRSPPLACTGGLLWSHGASPGGSHEAGVPAGAAGAAHGADPDPCDAPAGARGGGGGGGRPRHRGWRHDSESSAGGHHVPEEHGWAVLALPAQGLHLRRLRLRHQLAHAHGGRVDLQHDAADRLPRGLRRAGLWLHWQGGSGQVGRAGGGL